MSYLFFSGSIKVRLSVDCRLWDMNYSTRSKCLMTFHSFSFTVVVVKKNVAEVCKGFSGESAPGTGHCRNDVEKNVYKKKE